MQEISIPITKNNYNFLMSVANTDTFKCTPRDEIGMCLGACVRFASSGFNYHKKNIPEYDSKTIDRKLFPKEIIITYAARLAPKSGRWLIGVLQVNAVNLWIKTRINETFINYVAMQRQLNKHITIPECCQKFCETYNLDNSPQLQESLKKFEYRNRKHDTIISHNQSSSVWRHRVA